MKTVQLNDAGYTADGKWAFIDMMMSQLNVLRGKKSLSSQR